MTMKILLTQGQVALVDDADYEWLAQFKWHARRKPNGRVWYASRKFEKRQHHMHRVIIEAPAHLQVDHVDGNGLNNTRANLRLCTHGQNVTHRRYTQVAKSDYIGVGANGRYWVGHVGYEGKMHYTPTYSDALTAAQARDDLARQLHGEFAVLNFPERGAR